MTSSCYFFTAADQSRMMQEQMTMQAGGVQDPKQVGPIEPFLACLKVEFVSEMKT